MCVGVLNVARALAPELEFQLQHAAGNAIERLARSAAFMAHAIGMQYMWLAWRGVVWCGSARDPDPSSTSTRRQKAACPPRLTASSCRLHAHRRAGAWERLTPPCLGIIDLAVALDTAQSRAPPRNSWGCDVPMPNDDICAGKTCILLGHACSWGG